MACMKPFRCEAEWLGDSSAVITVVGEVDLHTSTRLREVLDEVRARDITDHLVVDLSECTFLDSTGLGMLVKAQQQARSPLNVVVAAPQVRKALSVTSLDSVFDLHDTREDALEALRRQVGEL
jgi:anti-sigma B factor antagonist